MKRRISIAPLIIMIILLTSCSTADSKNLSTNETPEIIETPYNFDIEINESNEIVEIEEEMVVPCKHTNKNYHTFTHNIIEEIGGVEEFSRWLYEQEYENENECGATIFDLMEEYSIDIERFKEIVEEDEVYNFLN